MISVQNSTRKVSLSSTPARISDIVTGAVDLLQDAVAFALSQLDPLAFVEFLHQSALLDLAQQAIIDEGFRVGRLGFRMILFDKAEHGFDSAQRGIWNVLVVFRDQ